MRDSSIKSGMMDSPANDMYTGMLDQEMSLKVAGGSTGLTDVIVHQLSRNLPGGDAGALPGAAGALNPLPPRSQSSLSSISALSPRSLSMLLLQDQDDGSGEPTIDASAAAASDPADPIDPDAGHQSGAAPADGSADPRQLAFVTRLRAHARVAQQLTGIPARFVLGQAALETGWGKHEMHTADGTPSHNLFGIKAGSDWTGRTVDVPTMEYENGVGSRVVQKFRAYGSDGEAFRDWSRLVAANPRYAGVVRNGHTASGFATGLQQAGYATDPAYAAKLLQTIGNPVLRHAI
jgi:flagellar protein FlgJ